MHIRSKLAIALLFVAASLVFAAPLFADGTDSFSFTNTLGNLGSTDTFNSGSLSVIATGYSSSGMTTNLYAKNEGPSETGLGLASGSDHEINGTAFIQLNLQSVLASNPSSVMVSVGSIQNPDTYSVWGSNSAGSPGTMLASNQTAGTFNLSNFSQYQYISVESATGTVLIDGLTVSMPSGGTSTASAPEPSSAALLLIGLASLAGLALVNKKL